LNDTINNNVSTVNSFLITSFFLEIIEKQVQTVVLNDKRLINHISTTSFILTLL